MSSREKQTNSKKIVREPKITDKDAKLRKKPVYKSFRLHKPIKSFRPPIATWWELCQMAFSLIWANRRALFTFILVYGLLNLLLVRGLQSPIKITELRDLYKDLFGGDVDTLATSVTSFSILLGSSTSSSGDVAQLFQVILLLIASLSIIWLYRQQQAGNNVTMKMAFYRGMFPAIPFLLVFLVFAAQALPGIIGNFVYTAAVNGNLLFGASEHIMMVTMMLSLLLLSLYMMSSSVMALYIVTLPEMTPMHALREARELVRHRRLQVLTRFLMLIAVVLFILFVITVPVIFFAPVAAEWVFYLITVLAVPFAHGYLFSMYRELLA